MKKLLLCSICFLYATVAFAQPVTIYGLTLGEKVNLPACPITAQNADKAIAHQLADVTQICASLRTLPSLKPGEQGIAIAFPAQQKPNFSLHNFVLGALDAEGRLNFLVILTEGLVTQEQVLNNLIYKFGPPVFIEGETENSPPILGKRLQALWNLYPRQTIVFIGQIPGKNYGTIRLSLH